MKCKFDSNNNKNTLSSISERAHNRVRYHKPKVMGAVIGKPVHASSLLRQVSDRFGVELRPLDASDEWIRENIPCEDKSVNSAILLDRITVPTQALYPAGTKVVWRDISFDIVTPFTNSVEVRKSAAGRNSEPVRYARQLMLGTLKSTVKPVKLLQACVQGGSHQTNGVTTTEGMFEYEERVKFYLVHCELSPDGKQVVRYDFESTQHIRMVTHHEEQALRNKTQVQLTQAFGRNATAMTEALRISELSDVGALFVEKCRLKEELAKMKAQPCPRREHMDSIKISLYPGWNFIGRSTFVRISNMIPHVHENSK